MMRKGPSSVHDAVRAGIESHGFFVYLVNGGVVPRYIYTVGMTGHGLPELLFAGGLFYSGKQALNVVKRTAALMIASGIGDPGEISSAQGFSFSSVGESYSRSLLLGTHKYYDDTPIRVIQVVPKSDRLTLDVPCAASSGQIQFDPVWKWCAVDWPFPVAATSLVTTNIQFLRGSAATEAARWGEEEWEVFAGPGPEVSKTDMRVISIATAQGIDPTIRPVIELAVGKALWRDNAQSEWQQWG